MTNILWLKSPKSTFRIHWLVLRIWHILTTENYDILLSVVIANSDAIWRVMSAGLWWSLTCGHLRLHNFVYLYAKNEETFEVQWSLLVATLNLWPSTWVDLLICDDCRYSTTEMWWSLTCGDHSSVMIHDVWWKHKCDERWHVMTTEMW